MERKKDGNEHFGICVEESELWIAPKSIKSTRRLTLGDLISVYSKMSGDRSKILLYDFTEKTWYNETYFCTSTAYHQVSPNCWPFLLSIENPCRRYKFFSNTSLFNYVSELQVNDVVFVSNILFSPGSPLFSIECNIIYVGPIKNLGQGIHFILKIVNGFSPQRDYLKTLDSRGFEEIAFLLDPERDLIVSPDYILKDQFKPKKKSTNFIAKLQQESSSKLNTVVNHDFKVHPVVKELNIIEAPSGRQPSEKLPSGLRNKTDTNGNKNVDIPVEVVNNFLGDFKLPEKKVEPPKKNLFELKKDQQQQKENIEKKKELDLVTQPVEFKSKSVDEEITEKIEVQENVHQQDLADVLVGVWPKEAGIMSDISNGGSSSGGGGGRGSDGSTTGNRGGGSFNGNRNVIRYNSESNSSSSNSISSNSRGGVSTRNKSPNPFSHFMQNSQKSSVSTQYDSTYNDHNGGRASGYKDTKHDYNRKNNEYFGTNVPSTSPKPQKKNIVNAPPTPPAKPKKKVLIEQQNYDNVSYDKIKETDKHRVAKTRQTFEMHLQHCDDQDDHRVENKLKDAHQDKYPPYSQKCEPHKQQFPEHSPPPQSPPPNQIPPKILPSVPNTDLEIGSMVEVSTLEDENLPGVIRWIGKFGGKIPHILIGVELTEKVLTKFDAAQNLKYFECAPNRAVYVKPDQCQKDTRFIEDSSPFTVNVYNSDKQTFGNIDCPIVPGSAISPKKICDHIVLKNYCGTFKGIQGHHNSCYLDATLFSMFAFTDVFDFLLFRGQRSDDIPNYTEVQTVLREEIVNPLRKNNFVRADRVLKLRKFLDQLSPVMGYTTEEKDPEEFLNTLFVHVFKAEPLLKLNSGQGTFCYQLFVEKDDRLKFPTVQQLFDQSFSASNIKLKEVPSCLIIQMPRFGNKYKMYPMILPSHILDVTDIIEDSPRQCCSCGDLAEVECKDCFDETDQVILEQATFCIRCFDIQHDQHERRRHHKKPPAKIHIPDTYKKMFNCNVPRLFMELFAVVCIETSHYVAFVKSATGADAPWCFFDSMADRRGEQNGYNIPELVPEPDISRFLTEDPKKTMAALDNQEVTKQTKRLLCDAYMCMYQSSSMAMYR